MKVNSVVFVLLLLSCSVPFKVLTQQDKFNPGVTQIYSSTITVKGSTPLDLSELTLQYNAFKSADSTRFGFYFIFNAKRWAHIESLKLLISGDVIDLRPVTEPKRVVGGLLGVTESILVDIPEPVIKRIMSTGSCDARVLGEHRSFDFIFDNDRIDKLKAFYSRVQ